MRFDPQYVDKKNKLSVLAVNDAETFYLYVSTGNDALKRQMILRGLTVWVDPGGGKKKVFGLYLPGIAGRGGSRTGLGSGPGEGPRPGHGGKLEDLDPYIQNESNRIAVAPLQDMDITYANATGPLKMTMEEVRCTGIDVSTNTSEDGKLIHAFKLNFASAPCLAALKPGMGVGIGIFPGRSKRDVKKKGGPGQDSNGQGGPGGGGRGGPGGGMGGLGISMGGPSGGGGGPGNEHPGKKGDVFETWIKVKLAGPSSG